MGYARGAGSLRPFLHYVYNDNETGDWYVRPISELGDRMTHVPHDVDGVYVSGCVLNIVGAHKTYSVYLKRDLLVKDYNKIVADMQAKHGPFSELHIVKELVGRNYGLPATQVYTLCTGGNHEQLPES